MALGSVEGQLLKAAGVVFRVSERIDRSGDGVILYDDDLVGAIDDGIFESPGPLDDSRRSDGLAGRGNTYRIVVAGRPCVQRHYYRGGFIGRLAMDAFLWAGEDRTRPFLEWRLLAELWRRGLPVPRPVAARFIRHGAWYTADLVTERLPGVRSLASMLRDGAERVDQWRRIGVMVARFHAEGVFHADLNASNIQVDGAGNTYLLDFDRGRLMPDRGRWTQRNMARLRRSVEKRCRESRVKFDERCWDALLAGYREQAAR